VEGLEEVKSEIVKGVRLRTEVILNRLLAESELPDINKQRAKSVRERLVHFRRRRNKMSVERCLGVVFWLPRQKLSGRQKSRRRGGSGAVNTQLSSWLGLRAPGLGAEAGTSLCK
jgi:hypothetical protein